MIFLILGRERTSPISAICRASVTTSTLPFGIKVRRSATLFPKRKLIHRFVSMTARTGSPSLPDRFHLRGDLLRGERSVLELALNPSQLFEKRLVIQVACEGLLLFLRESVNEFFDLREVEIELNRHFHSLSPISIPNPNRTAYPCVPVTRD